MTDDTILPFWFPAVRGKKLRAGFDGGRLSSDGGVMLLAQAARRMRIAEKLAAVIPDLRGSGGVCGYEGPGGGSRRWNRVRQVKPKIVKFDSLARSSQRADE